MIKKPTGKEYISSEFRELVQCLNCGKAHKTDLKDYQFICDYCKSLNLKKCEICTIILRTIPMLYFTYDTQEYYRGEENGFKTNAKIVREFMYTRKPLFPAYDENICQGCKDWESDIKNECFTCGEDFINLKENYKCNGNICKLCQKN